MGMMLEEDSLQGCEIRTFHVASQPKGKGLVRLRQWVTPQVL